jgi:hypothetical protein
MWRLLKNLFWPGKSSLSNDKRWKELLTVADVCRIMPQRVRNLFHSLDLESPDIAAVAVAVKEHDWEVASHALLDLYRHLYSDRSPRPPKPTKGRRSIADAILQDEFCLQGVAATIPQRANGGLDWYWKGPNNDHEFAFFLNRHEYLSDVVNAWQDTGNSEYIAYFERIIRDWIFHNPPVKAAPNDNMFWSSTWRPLEAGLRSTMWNEYLIKLYLAEPLSDATRLLMILGLGEHASFLVSHHGRLPGLPNIEFMELRGLGLTGLNHPAFKDAEEWFQHAANRMAEMIEEQLYPDGVQKELAWGYHLVGALNIRSLLDGAAELNRPIPEKLRGLSEKMWDYIAYTLRPDQGNPMTGDSDRGDFGDLVLYAADWYNRPDWRYIATNGRNGQSPEGPPSRFYPWAGQLVTRSGWDADAHWAFFDAGPLGLAHYHEDKTHLSIYAYGRDLLVDSGRFAYGGAIAEKFSWNYAVKSCAHNVILIDDRGQLDLCREATQPISSDAASITEAWDYALAKIDSFEEIANVTHTRVLVYLRGHFWIAVDTIDTETPRELTALWHFHPNCALTAEHNQLLTTDKNKGNLRILPFGPIDWETSIICGQEDPEVQGWYSPEYNKPQPAPVGVMKARIKGSTTFGWLFLPARGPVPVAEVEAEFADADKAIPITVTIEGQTVRLIIPLSSSEVQVGLG